MSTTKQNIHGFAILLLCSASILLATSALATPAPDASPQDIQPGLPLRATFYYPWFPEAWKQLGITPYTNYHPTLGEYDSGDQALIRQHLAAMQYAGIQAGIVSWWQQGAPTDQRLPFLLSATAGSTFRWSIYYEMESLLDPSVSQITADLTYLRDRYSADPSYLRIDGRFVVFVYADGADDCTMADRWKQANTVNAYIVLKVFNGYLNCASQPDGWHQYSPAFTPAAHGVFSYTISPGFHKVGEAPRLDRNLTRWKQNIRDMIASKAAFQLITTFNEWGEGTAVESASEWASGSGYGLYLDALHTNGTSSVFLPLVLKLQATPSPTPTISPTPTTNPAPTPTSGPTPTSQPLSDPVIIAVGDIASCNSTGDEATAGLLDSLAGTVLALGDNAYESGTAAEYSNCFDPSWGRHKNRIRPVPGNHEYVTPGASGYYNYFGAVAGDPQKGYYSYDLGAWHIIAINSNCSDIGGCNSGSAQEQWLRADLAAHPSACTLAYWHHPRFSSGLHGNTTSMQPIWQALYDAHADLVLNGHDHTYERFALQDPSGNADSAQGLREFVVGTGGASHYTISQPIAHSEVHNDNTFGVLKLTLHPSSYDWTFVPEAGKAFTDSGSTTCH